MTTAKRSSLALLMPILLLSSCKKLIEIDTPIHQVINTEVFKSDSLAQAAVLGIYSDMSASATSYSSGQTTLYTALSANELWYYTPGLRDEFANCDIEIGSHSTLNASFWNLMYKHIYITNMCFEQLNGSVVSPALKARLTGEVLFLRAFCYFQLVNLFGDVPLVTGTDYRINAQLPRSSVETIYDQLIVDLKAAAETLPVSYAGGNRVRATRWAALALLARIHLYRNNWQQAADASAELINQNLFALTPLANVFVRNSTEGILQLQPVNPTWNTWEAREILPATANETPKYLLTDRLFQAFEQGDNRKTAWVTSRVFNGQTLRYPAKYKVYGNGAALTEFYTVLRLAEQYLIRAEARAHLSDIDGGLADLNIIRRRAGLTDTTASGQQELFRLIEHERQSELFVEWGHRWFDLRRTNRINEVMSAIHPASWKPEDALYPIPVDQLNLNPSLTQNPGY